MWDNNCTVEDYGAWRRERVEEAADLARYINYHDLAGWHRIQEIDAEARRARGDDGLLGLPGRIRRALHAVVGRLALRVSPRQPTGGA